MHEGWTTTVSSYLQVRRGDIGRIVAGGRDTTDAVMIGGLARTILVTAIEYVGKSTLFCPKYKNF